MATQIKEVIKEATSKALDAAGGDSEVTDALTRVSQAAIDAANSVQPDPALTELSLQAEYAIGKDLITQPELDGLRNRYGAQGDLSLGLLPPFLFLVFALLVEGQTEGLFGYAFALFAVAVISGVLFFLAIERRSQYRTELRLLLLGRIQKQLDIDQAAKQAKKDAKSDAASKGTPDAITKAVQDAISKLKLEVKPLVVQVQTDSSAGSSGSAPSTGPATANPKPSTPPASSSASPAGSSSSGQTTSAGTQPVKQPPTEKK